MRDGAPTRGNLLEAIRAAYDDLEGDYAFVHAFIGDHEGNLRYAKTARNFNHVMATAAKVTIAEVETIVEAGELDGNYIHTPGVYVHRMIKVPRPHFAITID